MTRPDRRTRGAAVLLAAMTLGGNAGAQDAVPDRLAGQAPMEISASSAELTRDGNMRYSGDVVFTSQNLEVRGDTLVLERNTDDGVHVRISGQPAELTHTPPESESDRRPIEARAQRIAYHRGSGVVELEGAVALTRGTDRLRGEQLRYEIASQRITASGGSGGRVRITIDPETVEDLRE